MHFLLTAGAQDQLLIHHRFLCSAVTIFLQIHSAAVTVIEIFFGIETFFRSCLSVLEKSLLMWPFFISDTKSDYLLCFQSPYRSDSSDQPSVQSLSETFQCQIMVFMFFFSIFGQVKPAI